MLKNNRNKRIHKLMIVTTFTLMLCFGISMMAQTAVVDQRSEYQEICVQEGDTLWAIANQVSPEGVDKRKVVYNIQQINGIKENIYPGQVLLVPTID